MAKAGVWVLGDKYNQKTQKGLIRVNNKYVDELKASLSLVSKINNKDVLVRTLGVSGILKKAENKYLAS